MATCERLPTTASEAADGKKTKTEVTITYDGKVHPAAGNPDWDSAAATRIGPNETMTMNIRVTKANGTTETALSVLDRQ
jgi:hypothetical protein